MDRQYDIFEGTYARHQRVNFNRLNFNYFITQGNGTIVGSAKDGEGNDFAYAIACDGTVRAKKNGGIWNVLSILEAASLRYYVGRVYKRDSLIPHYRTNHVAI